MIDATDVIVDWLGGVVTGSLAASRHGWKSPSSFSSARRAGSVAGRSAASCLVSARLRGDRSRPLQVA